MLLHITLTVPESKDTWLAAFNVWLDPLRLPLFFLVSGFFAQKVFRFSFAELFTRRLWYFLVPYVVWMLVELQTKRVEYHWVFGDPIFDVDQMAASLLVGHSMAWFLHALILFNIFLWCVRKLPGWAAMALSFTPILFIAWQAQYTSIAKAIMFLPVFVGAAYFRDAIAAFTSAIEAPFKGTWDHRSFWAYSGMIVAYAIGFFTRRAWDNYSASDRSLWLPHGAPPAGGHPGGSMATGKYLVLAQHVRALLRCCVLGPMGPRQGTRLGLDADPTADWSQSAEEGTFLRRCELEPAAQRNEEYDKQEVVIARNLLPPRPRQFELLTVGDKPVTAGQKN